jgi:hypothetical protein
MTASDLGKHSTKQHLPRVQVLMNWNQEELEQWAVTQQQKEEDNDAIAGYRAQDESKIKELKIAVERMSKTVASRKDELDREVTDTQVAQVQLDKAADDFARLHKVRVQPAATASWPLIEGANRSNLAIAAALWALAGPRLNAPHACETCSRGDGSQACARTGAAGADAAVGRRDGADETQRRRDPGRDAALRGPQGEPAFQAGAARRQGQVLGRRAREQQGARGADRGVDA